MFVALFGVLGGVFYGGYSYYKDTQARISQLTANNALDIYYVIFEYEPFDLMNFYKLFE